MTDLLGRIGRRYWIRRIDRVLAGAYEHGLIDSFVLHALDARMKYHPDKPWKRRGDR